MRHEGQDHVAEQLGGDEVGSGAGCVLGLVDR